MQALRSHAHVGAVRQSESAFRSRTEDYSTAALGSTDSFRRAHDSLTRQALPRSMKSVGYYRGEALT